MAHVCPECGEPCPCKEDVDYCTHCYDPDEDEDDEDDDYYGEEEEDWYDD